MPIRGLVARPIPACHVPPLSRSCRLPGRLGLREAAGDVVEEIGIGRARGELGRADLVLWLGAEADRPDGAWNIAAQIDRPDHAAKDHPRHRISAVTGAGLDALRADLLEAARDALPKPGAVALNRRQRLLLDEARAALAGAGQLSDPLLLAEELRRARHAFDQLVGRTATEDLLDTLFGRFCIGK